MAHTKNLALASQAKQTSGRADDGSVMQCMRTRLRKGIHERPIWTGNRSMEHLFLCRHIRTGIHRDPQRVEFCHHELFLAHAKNAISVVAEKLKNIPFGRGVHLRPQQFSKAGPKKSAGALNDTKSYRCHRFWVRRKIS